MTAPRKGHRPHGRRIRCAGGYFAFVPAPLPPPIVWDGALTVALSRADFAIGRLAGEGRRFPNPHLFIRSFVRREAVLSSRIEGTRTTLAELLAAEAGGTGATDAADLREVGNYVAALEYGLERVETLPLSLRLIRELHERLMRGIRGDAAAPGELRRSQNWIGPPGCGLNDATYVPPPVEELAECLYALERFLHEKDLPPLVLTALAHAQFEAIHPFVDGNGRVGRLLITLLLVERGLLPSPLLYLSAYFEATRESLLCASARGDRGRRLGGLADLFSGRRALAGRGRACAHRANRHPVGELAGEFAGARPGRAEEVLRLFVENPFRTVREIGRKLGVAYTTARRAVDRLEDAGIVSLVGERRRNRVYCARAVLAALETPVDSGVRF